MRQLCAVLLLAAVTAGCERPIRVQPRAVEDAQLGVQVKTALVNDKQLGPRVIEVRVTRGLVILAGVVASDEEVARAIELARAVPGVTDVRSQLVVREAAALVASAGVAPPDRPTPPDDEIVSASQRRLLALGMSLNARQPHDDRLGSSLFAGPLVRLGSGRGLGVAFGFSWFRADLFAASSPSALGRITIRPFMGGLSYTLTDQARLALSLSMVGGVAFNRYTLGEPTVPDVLPLEVDNSVAVRPGVSLWVDLNSRAAFNVFTGYLITRPQITFLEDGQFAKRTMRADTAVLNVGLAYKVF